MTAEPATPESVAVALRFEDAGTDPTTDVPHTRVMLAVIRESDGRTETHEVRVVNGPCSFTAPTGGALTAGSCWWAGSGDNFEVVREGDEVLVRLAEVAEELDAPLPSVTALRVPLPASAQLQVVAPDTAQ